MVKKFGAPVLIRPTLKQHAITGMHVLLIFCFVLLSACSPQAVVQSSPTLPVSTTMPATATPLPSNTSYPSPTVTFSPVPTNTATPVPDLQKILDTYTASIPVGQWGIYIENLKTGQTATYHADEDFHPASTVKIYLAVAFLYWMDQHPDVSWDTKPEWDANRSYREILEASLATTDEIATGEIYRFLNNQEGYNAYVLAKSWGALRTTFGPRQSTPADLGLLLKRLYSKEILSEQSRQIFFSILQTSGQKISPVSQAIPESQRSYLVEKNSNVFTESLNIMADTALFQRDDCAYTLTILTNKVEPLLQDKVANLMEAISKETFNAYCGMPSGESYPTDTPMPVYSPTPEPSFTPTLTFTPLPPTPTFTPSPTDRYTATATPDTPFTRDVNQLLSQIPSGISGLYFKNFKTGEVVSVHGNDTFHIASTIKV